MTDELRPCLFTFDWSRDYRGVTDDTRWNGFLNVRVLPAERDRIAADLMAAEDPASAREILALPASPDGYVSLANGYATTETCSCDAEDADCNPDCRAEGCPR